MKKVLIVIGVLVLAGMILVGVVWCILAQATHGIIDKQYNIIRFLAYIYYDLLK